MATHPMHAADRTPLMRWMARQPHPIAFRCTDAEGGERVIKVGILRTKWRDAARAAINFTQIEALDAEGAILRIWEDTDNSEGKAKVDTATAAKTSDDIRLVEFAKLYTDGCDKAALRHAEAYKMAFDLFAVLVKVQSDRLQALEKAWHKMIMAAGGEEQGAEGALAGADALVAGLVGQLMAGNRESPEEKPNGAR